MDICKEPVYRVYPGGRTELVRSVPTGTVILHDAEVANDKLSMGEMVYVDRNEWEDLLMELPQRNG
jgi:hypothetical protein